MRKGNQTHSARLVPHTCEMKRSMWRATPAMATSGVLMAEAESGSCGSSPACNEGGKLACQEGGWIWREEIVGSFLPWQGVPSSPHVELR